MAFSGNFVTQALPLPRGCLTVLGIRRMGSLSRGANPGTESQFPANGAGNSVSVHVSPGFAACFGPPRQKTVTHPSQVAFGSQTAEPIEWRPQGDSNPCYRRERAVS